MQKLLFFLAACLFFQFPARANVSLPAIFGDNMVLQREANVKIWGWAKPGEEIEISSTWSDEIFTTKADKNAIWSLEIKTNSKEGPQELIIQGYNEVSLKNLLLGELWLISGQSNMEWSASAGITNAETAIENSTNKNIRFFSVDHRTADSPQIDLEGSWVDSSPETMKYFSAIGYFFAKKLQEDLDVPIGIINSSWGGTPAEVWMPGELFHENKNLKKAAAMLDDNEWGPNKPALLYNAMIHPLTSMKIKGILWYQGESNTANADYYEKIFSSLVKSWRSKWEEDLPFYYAQIAPFDYGEGFAGVKVRDAQRKVLKLSKTGMVMTSDVGNIHDIHPQDKLTPGIRFANLALAEVYGKKIKAHAPQFDHITTEGKIVKVHFKYSEGLKIDPENPESQFEIAGSNKEFYPARMEIKNNIIHLKAKAIRSPVFVRYSWQNTASSNIFNAAGLPASSFTTQN
ncbi:sialate O-acetylesterase [Salegentibacter sp. Hel_I_6]|uniref:sialate O-acetylesterase n=1 Tax=Salegentibacter sp. Hel_I_6 TaxID=1250278 RepID=UPI00055ED297|nr:sialate O-acetylesterase [Salegentibacter sp. Hel_I_6]